MRFIISPAKKMNECPDLLEWKDLPLFLEEARALATGLEASPTRRPKSCGSAMIKLRSSISSGLAEWS